MKGGNIMENEILQKILKIVEDTRLEMQGMKSEMQGMKSEIQGMNQRLISVEDTTTKIATDVSNINLVIENDIRHSIQAVADGHLDLYRKMEEASSMNGRVTSLEILVKSLSADIEKLKKAQ